MKKNIKLSLFILILGLVLTTVIAFMKITKIAYSPVALVVSELITLLGIILLVFYYIKEKTNKKTMTKE
jgi:type III secretory pathway component EscU